MQHLNVSYCFIGYQPKFDERVYFKTLAERLSLEAPSDAVIKIKCEKSTAGFSMSCRIVSTPGIFESAVTHRTIYRASSELEAVIRRQLDIWKSRRWKREELLEDETQRMA